MCWRVWRRFSAEVIRYVLLCKLDAVDGGLCLLEVPEVPVMHCLLLSRGCG